MKGKLAKILMVVALLALVTVMVIGCNRENGGDDEPAATDPPTANGGNEVTGNEGTGDDTTDPVPPAERVTVVMAMNSENGMDDTDAHWKYGAVEYMEELLGINLVLRSQTTDQDTLMIAAGDIPDIFQARNEFMPQLIQGRHIQPLDDLVANYAPDIAADPARLDFLRRFQSEGTGQLWGITNYRGEAGHFHTPVQVHFVRWDLYSQLGYPEIRTPEDMIDVLYQMVQLEPNTPDGLPTYGLGAWGDWGMWPMGGLSRQPGTTISTTLHLGIDGTHIHPLVDINSDVWFNLRMFNRADQLGIWDRDSLIQTYGDYGAKARLGQYMSINASWIAASANAIQFEEDPNTLRGHVFMPFDGMWVYANTSHPFGHIDHLYTIGANSEVAPHAMRLINYLNSYDGIRQLMSGTVGTTIEMIDGRPEIMTSLLDEIAGGGDPLDPLLWDNPNMMGFSGFTRHPVDGQPLNLMLTGRAFALQNTHLDTVSSNHFGADFPFGIVQRFMAEGRAFDFSSWNSPLVGALESPTMDIERIDGLLNEILWRTVPSAIMAESDAAFEAVFEAAVAEFMAAGHAEHLAWSVQAYEAAYAALAEFLR